MLYTDIDSTNVEHGYRTDHSMVTLTLKLWHFERGLSHWKFNKSLLKDIDYVTKIRQLITRIKTQYAQTNQEPLENISNKDLNFDISDQLFFETLLMEIRGSTISYSSFIKQQNQSNHDDLIKEIE